jgi:hypothetical protein
MIDFEHLDASLDLWLSMWGPNERKAFEAALERSLGSEHPQRLRLTALAACHIIATRRLLEVAVDAYCSGTFTNTEIEWVETSTLARHNLLRAARHLRGNLYEVEVLLQRILVNRQDGYADVMLDWLDVRDLVAVARTATDPRLAAEAERRVGRRGKYQLGRVTKVLGFAAGSGSADWDYESLEVLASR